MVLLKESTERESEICCKNDQGRTVVFLVDDVAVQRMHLLCLVYMCTLRPLCCLYPCYLYRFLRLLLTQKKKEKLFVKRGCVCECVNHAGEIDLVGSQRQMNHPRLE